MLPTCFFRWSREKSSRFSLLGCKFPAIIDFLLWRRSSILRVFCEYFITLLWGKCRAISTIFACNSSHIKTKTEKRKFIAFRFSHRKFSLSACAKENFRIEEETPLLEKLTISGGERYGKLFRIDEKVQAVWERGRRRRHRLITKSRLFYFGLVKNIEHESFSCKRQDFEIQTLKTQLLFKIPPKLFSCLARRKSA